MATQASSESVMSINERRKEWLFEQMNGHWRTVDWLSKYSVEEFPDFIVHDTPIVNQGWFDPKFCVTRRHPGQYIKSGELIFRRSQTGGKSRYEYTLRSSATEEEILECESFAAECGLFIFGLTGEGGKAQ
jgi:hypothetical protein